MKKALLPLDRPQITMLFPKIAMPITQNKA
jgi:hypothetical protein